MFTLALITLLLAHSVRNLETAQTKEWRATIGLSTVAIVDPMGAGVGAAGGLYLSTSLAVTPERAFGVVVCAWRYDEYNLLNAVVNADAEHIGLSAGLSFEWTRFKRWTESSYYRELVPCFGLRLGRLSTKYFFFRVSELGLLAPLGPLLSIGGGGRTSSGHQVDAGFALDGNDDWSDEVVASAFVKPLFRIPSMRVEIETYLGVGRIWRIGLSIRRVLGIQPAPNSPKR